MGSKRIKNAIEIINYAIDNDMSVKQASIKYGFAGSYVKNVRRFVNSKFENDELDVDLYNGFDSAYNRYVRSREQKSETVDRFKSNKERKTDTTGDVNTNTTGGVNKVRFEVEDDRGVAEWRTNSYQKGHIKTLDQLLEKCEVDKKVWNVRSYVVNKWDTTMRIDNQPRTIENFQVKANLEKNYVQVRNEITAEVFQEMVKNYNPPKFEYVKKDVVNSKENNLLEVSIFDLHLGKLAWGGETGENYDTKIASERFLYSIKKLLERAAGFSYNRILFPVGSDFFNSDTILNTTTAGTPQDEDLRWQKTFTTGIKLVVDGIELLKQTGVPVDVLVIPGNHDFERSFYLGTYLSAWYKDDKMVNIDNGASPRKYYKFGQVLLGFTHGSEEKESSLPMIMANDIESKKHWSETTYHEWHLGHIHRKRNTKYTVLEKDTGLAEDLGVTIRYLSSLTGTEEWHHKKGFIGQIKAADAFIWNDEYGFVAHLNSNIIIEEYKE